MTKQFNPFDDLFDPSEDEEGTAVCRYCGEPCSWDHAHYDETGRWRLLDSEGVHSCKHNGQDVRGLIPPLDD